MTNPIPRARIFVTYDSARGTRIFVNDPTRIDDTELHVSMSCSMSVDPQRNRGIVVVRNLSETTREDLSGVIESTLDMRGASRGLADLFTLAELVDVAVFETATIQKTTTIEIGGGYCEIDAGLDEHVGRIFEGSVSRIRSTKSGPEWRTTFEIGDGLTTATGAVSNQSFNPGANTFDVVKSVVRDLGLSIGTLTLDQFQSAVSNLVSVLGRGYNTIGNSNAILKQILQFTGAEWFVDRGTFFIVRKGHPIDPAQKPVVLEQDVSGGLRSVPTPIDDRGILIEADFRSDVRVGRLVQTVSRQLSGVWRADVVDHQIDNRGGPWLTRAILRKLPDLDIF